jgi:hypothetical protein
MTRIIADLSVLSAVQGGNCGGRRESKPGRSGNRLFCNEITARKKRNRSLFPFFRDYGNLCATLQVEDGVSDIALRKEGVLWLNLTIRRPSPAFARKPSTSN